jgi:hypothetical protein
VRRHSGEGWRRWRGPGAAVGVGEGRGILGSGNGGAERQLHGELELAGQWWRGRTVWARAGEGTALFIGKGGGGEGSWDELGASCLGKARPGRRIAARCVARPSSASWGAEEGRGAWRLDRVPGRRGLRRTSGRRGSFGLGAAKWPARWPRRRTAPAIGTVQERREGYLTFYHYTGCNLFR